MYKQDQTGKRAPLETRDNLSRAPHKDGHPSREIPRGNPSDLEHSGSDRIGNGGDDGGRAHDSSGDKMESGEIILDDQSHRTDQSLDRSGDQTTNPDPRRDYSRSNNEYGNSHGAILHRSSMDDNEDFKKKQLRDEKGGKKKRTRGRERKRAYNAAAAIIRMECDVL